MSKLAGTAALGCALMLAGCIGGPPVVKVQDIDYMEGCWVAADSEGINFKLRLQSTRDRKALAGDLFAYPNDTPEREAHITLVRDGASATILKDGASGDFVWRPADESREPDGWLVRYKLADESKFGAMYAWGDGKALSLIILTPTGGPMFDGVSEPCD